MNRSTALASKGSTNGLSHEQELLDLLPDAYLATDRRGRILEANAAASDLFEFGRSELLGSSLLDFVPRDAERVAAVMGGEVSAAWGEGVEARLMSSSGRFIIAELRACAARPDRRRIRWFIRDVTGQRLTEQALREERDSFRRLATQLPVLTYSLDAPNPAGVPTFVSPVMAELFALPVADLRALAEGWIRRIHPDDRGRVLTERARACEKVTAMRCEYRVLTADGHVRWVRDEVRVIGPPGPAPSGPSRVAPPDPAPSGPSRIAPPGPAPSGPSRADGSSAPRLQGVIVDTTSRGARAQMPARVRQGHASGPDARERARSRRGLIQPGEDGNRRTFLRLFLHDVRSPLAVAVGIVETLLREEEGLAAEQRRDLLSRAVQNLEHIHHLLSEVVDIERLEQRQVAVRLEPTDVKMVVERMVRALRETGHAIEFRGSVCMAQTDPTLVERAVSKLLDNAFMHTPPATAIRVAVEEANDGVLVRVDDEGPGVPDEYKERIFEAFDRGQAPPTTAGFGLGLALVRHIVHVLGGQTWVEDRPGGGASFRLFLPSGPA